MKPIDLINVSDTHNLIAKIFEKIHDVGPIDQEDLESLAYLKYFHESDFKVSEPQLMFILGLFYKLHPPEDLIGYSYSIFSNAIFEETGQYFTPVQASIRNKIIENRYFSFSAPTSAGKSFLFRELIKSEMNDIIIVVPSRALIAEYILAVREIVATRNDILVLQFIDDVNKKKTTRRVFVVTPERGAELFKEASRFSPSLFLFDEAQISEEKIRGVSFDSFVRRADRIFPKAKKVFAHPFIENPGAQLTKHRFSDDSSSKSYNQNTVGKIFLKYSGNLNSTFWCFSPFINDAHLKVNQAPFPRDIVKETLLSGGTVLIYVSKASIYDKSIEDNFAEYIELCSLITDQEAISIIDEVEDLIGAKNRKSELIDLMRKGVVIHHGSIPLSVRFLIEQFTNLNFSRICFATSTLAQGVNMPFDVVWIENIKFTGSKESQALGIKNLIGRAGRNTTTKDKFDYGYVIVKDIKGFVQKLTTKTSLRDISVLDDDQRESSDDTEELISAVKNNEFNDLYNLPNSRVDRLGSQKVALSIKALLDMLFEDGHVMTSQKYLDLRKASRKALKELFAHIFEASLGREIYTGERTVLSAAITILLWKIQGKTFREVLGRRYSYLTQEKEQRRIRSLQKKGEINTEEMTRQIQSLPIIFSPIPFSLPDSTLRSNRPSRFARKQMKDFNYDLVVYDTYDFLDKVISFSLSDTFVAAFDQYYSVTNDVRARHMVDYFKYGTIDSVEIWLIRYGFSMEQCELIMPFVHTINAEQIVFDKKIHLSENIRILELVARYV